MSPERVFLDGVVFGPILPKSKEFNTHPLLYAAPETPAHGSGRTGCVWQWVGKGGWTGGPRVWARRGALRVLLIHERVVHDMRFTTRTDIESFSLNPFTLL